MRLVDFARRIAALGLGLFAALPLGAQATPPQSPNWTADREIFVPMRDGVHLDTDVLLPKGAHGPLPTILVRTPYDKDDLEWVYFKDWYETFLKAGYAFVLQNERGRYFSEGTYTHYLEGTGTDGYDTVEWITKQPWSNGKVGAFGCSSSGETQWGMANSLPPGFAAMIPGASGTAIGSIPGNDTQGAVYRGGVPVTGLWAWWYHDMATTERLELPANSTPEQRLRLRTSFTLRPAGWFYHLDPDNVDLTKPKNDASALLMQLPAKDALRRLGGALTPWDDFVTKTPGDAYWNDVPLAKAGLKSQTPALLLESWHDIGVGEMARVFQYLQDQNTKDQYLVVGAGAHCVFLDSGKELATLSLGDLKPGDSRYRGDDDGYKKLVLGWYDHFLKGDANGVTDMPKVQLQVMGKGWISGNKWPLENTQYVKYYLDSAVPKGAHAAHGTLGTELPTAQESDSYVYDPANPTPTRGGGCCGKDMSVDQRDVEKRSDVLSYTTAALKQPVTIAGPVGVTLFVSSSAKDTDFIVKLIDVYPDGKAVNLSDDGFRVRYREGYDKQVFMKPGEVYEIHLTNMVTAAYFPVGHHIRLDVASSNFPAMERNLNTGGNNYDEVTWVTATNAVHHSAAHPSEVTLPIIPN